jgi:hypothetical protein
MMVSPVAAGRIGITGLDQAVLQRDHGGADPGEQVRRERQVPEPARGGHHRVVRIVHSVPESHFALAPRLEQQLGPAAPGIDGNRGGAEVLPDAAAAQAGQCLSGEDFTPDLDPAA